MLDTIDTRQSSYCCCEKNLANFECFTVTRLSSDFYYFIELTQVLCKNDTDHYFLQLSTYTLCIQL